MGSGGYHSCSSFLLEVSESWGEFPTMAMLRRRSGDRDGSVGEKETKGGGGQARI